MPRIRLHAAGVILALLSLAASPAHAWQLEWSAPPSCPQADDVREEVARILASNAVLSDALDVRATVQHEEPLWQAEVRLRDGENSLGARTLSAGACEELSQALALVIALTAGPDAIAPAPQADPDAPLEPETNDQVDPESPDPAGTPAPEDTPASEDTPAPEDTPASEDTPAEDTAPEDTPASEDTPSEDTAPEDTAPEDTAPEDTAPEDTAPEDTAADSSRSPDETRWLAERGHRLSLAAGVDIGTLPAPSASLALGYRGQWKHLSVAGSAASLLPRDSAGDGPGGRFTLLAVRLEAALSGRLKRLILRIGARAEVGALRASGRNVVSPQASWTPWAAIGGVAGLGFRIGRVRLMIDGVLMAPLSRRRFEIIGEGLVHQPGAFIGRFHLSAEISLGRSTMP